jgi:hypothetical protein
MLSGAAFAGGVPDTLLYQQLPTPGAAFISSAQPGGDFTFDDVRTADNFIIPIPARVYRIDWWGGDHLSSGAFPPLWNITAFNIRVYQDFVPDEPVTLLFERTVDIDDIEVTPTGNPTGEFGSPEFRFSFRSDTILFDNPAMWISIAAEYFVPPEADFSSFAWSGASEFDPFLAQDVFDGTGFQLVTGPRTNAAFAIYGQVPAPGAFMVLGLAGLTAVRRKR